jgi:hypothetical protein
LIVGWRIRRFAGAWAVVGPVYWVANVVFKLMNPPGSVGMRTVDVKNDVALLTAVVYKFP